MNIRNGYTRIGSSPRRRGGHILILLLAACLVALTPATGSADSTAGFVTAFGSSGRPQVSPGGIDVDETGAVYIADTGKDTVSKYLANASQPVWEVGRRGYSVAAPSFVNPRDVAVLDDLVYVAEPAGVRVLNAADGRYLRSLSYAFNVPIGVSIGNTPAGAPLILVADGQSGKVVVFDRTERYVRSIPPMSASSGTRDADTDSAGNFYVADYRGDRIAKFDPQGRLLLTWGGATAAKCAQIPGPYGVHVDDADRVYVAASDNNALRSFTAEGQCIRQYGSSGTAPTQLSQLRRVAVGRGPDPKVYAADLWGLKVLIFNQDGTLAGPLAQLGNGQYPRPGMLNEVPAVAVGPGGVYTTDLNSHRISRWSTDGALRTTWGKKGKGPMTANLNWPSGLGVDPRNGNVWVADTHSNIIKEFAPDGSGPLRSLGPGGTAPATFSFPQNIAVDSSGTIYVADYTKGRVQAFSAALVHRWTATGMPGATGIALDQSGGRLFVAAPIADKVFVLSAGTGAKSTLAIPSGTAAGRLSRPIGVAVDAQRNIWVSDNANRVQQFRPDGTYTGTTIGSFGSGPGQFNTPMGLAFGPDGLLYVADAFNDRVQVFDVG